MERRMSHRGWSAEWEEDEGYDMEDTIDLEKHRGSTQDPFMDSDDDSRSSTAHSSTMSSSRDVSGSYRPMLHREAAEKRRTKPYYLYRVPNRVMRYLCLALISTVFLFILNLVRMSWESTKRVEIQRMLPSPSPQWESFENLTRYYGGLRTLVPREENVPEYPRDEGTPVPEETDGFERQPIPQSAPFDPYPDYSSVTDGVQYPQMEQCFLNEESKQTVPAVHFYTGVPRGFPDAVMGSYKLLNLRDDVCFERFGRLGPYGFGYSKRRGGIGAGLDGEREGAESVWRENAEVDYSKIQWGEIQERCLAKNDHRFRPIHRQSEGDLFRDTSTQHPDPLVGAEGDGKALRKRELPSTSTSYVGTNQTEGTSHNVTVGRLPRTAVVIRTWAEFRYSAEDILYLRSLISELSLLSGGEYVVHFLIHVRDDNAPIWADRDRYDEVLADSLHDEFAGMGTLWSEREMGLIYGGLPESFFRSLPVHGVYRSTYMPIQYFAHQHPEYDFFWNWEMDVRYTGQWYHLFDSLRRWAKKQPRKGLWERNGRFYIPSVHGSWEDFKQMVRVQAEMSPVNQKAAIPGFNTRPSEGNANSQAQRPEKPVWGPLAPSDVLPLVDDPIPPTTYDKDKYAWGVGAEADLITFNPMFDPEGTTWLLAEDVTGYNTGSGNLPPRRAAVITASRLSRRLLDTMHRETALQRHTMFSEMWPSSCALHHGLKAVYAPHPVYVDRDWPLAYLAGVMNGGRNGASGGARTSVFGEREHNFHGTTWYYDSIFAPDLWRRWLGYRVKGKGGEEAELAGEGRMCLPGMLLHPIKELELVIESPEEDG